MEGWKSECGQQQTLARPAVVSGPGLFHGVDARLRMLPAPENSGIVFRRVDLRDRPEIPASTEFVVPGSRRTILASGAASVETVEHLLAALAGLHVDNCIVEIRGPEVPAVDGSCLPFCEAILEAGINQQFAPRRVTSIDRCQRISDPASEQWLEAIPSATGDLVISYQLDYGQDSPLGRQSLALAITPETFLHEIAAARTFVMSAEVDALQAQGYGRHLTGRDLVVFAPDGTVVDNRLRWPDEPVRHKILDCIGDLSLAGAAVSGRIVARRSGHKLNHVMAQILSTTAISGFIPARAA
ncbi:MAG: UDP-3-O-[3-hydroxymyristoyl] N-acetylglucosamine deacetylase [Planctomycetota bacterium]|jgi:UDP-3-O-acyl N-acetylglucosamine deacetylase